MKVNTRFKSLVFASAALLILPAFVPGVFRNRTAAGTAASRGAIAHG